MIEPPSIILHSWVIGACLFFSIMWVTKTGHNTNALLYMTAGGNVPTTVKEHSHGDFLGTDLSGLSLTIIIVKTAIINTAINRTYLN